MILTVTDAKIFFSNENLLIHSTKEIGNFKENYEILDVVIGSLRKINETIMEIPNMTQIKNKQNSNDSKRPVCCAVLWV